MSKMVQCKNAGEFVKCVILNCYHAEAHAPVGIEGRGRCNSGFGGNFCAKEECVAVPEEEGER